MTRRAARALLAGLALPVVVWLGGSPASAAVLPAGFQDETVFDDLQEPTTFRFASDGRVFVAEKTGRILVFSSLSDSVPDVFADLRTEVYDTGDRGLLGLALDPEFPTKPYVYALYTYDHLLGDPEPAPKWGEPNHSGDECNEKPSGTGVDACPVSGRLSRFEVIDDHTPGPEEVLAEGWCQQYSSHSIGDLEFAPDGALYASGGDGSDANGVDYGQNGWPQKNQCGDPPSPAGTALSPPTAEGGALRAQDLRTSGDPTGLSGSLIRIDPDTGDPLPGNPLFGAGPDENAERIVAYGFRNPYRLAIEPQSGDVYVANVGWNTYEELDRVSVAPDHLFNSGWPCYEGPGPNQLYKSLELDLCEGLYAEAGSTSAPFFFYKHSAGVAPEDGCSHESGSAISGLSFYGSGPFPDAYDGALFFADAVRGCIYVMQHGDNGRPDPLSATTFMSGAGLYPGVDVAVGPDGDLYYAQLFDEGDKGSIHRISYQPDAPLARLTASPRSGPGTIEAHLDASGSTDPQSKALTYEWDLDGNGTFETAAGSQLIETYGGTENVTVAVRVSNGTSTSIARQTLYPGDTAPKPVIQKPATTLTWGVGQQIEFLGYGEDSDEENAKVPAPGLYWKVRVAHCPSACHLHPLQLFPAVDHGTFAAPDHDYPSHLEISLTATDSRGLSVTKAVSIDPRTVALQIGSVPSGLTLSAGLLNQPAPFTLTAIEGSSVPLAAPAQAQLGGTTYTWSKWSDGGARVHTVQADAGASYTATYAGGGGGGSPSDGGSSGTSGSSPIGGPLLVPNPVPATGLRKHPPKRTQDRIAKFTFGADVSGASFRCSLDGGRPRSCRSPRVYRGLAPGSHVFKVFAVVGGVADPTAARFAWRVLS